MRKISNTLTGLALAGAIAASLAAGAGDAHAQAKTYRFTMQVHVGNVVRSAADAENWCKANGGWEGGSLNGDGTVTCIATFDR